MTPRRSSAEDLLRAYGDTPAVRHLIETKRLAEQAHAYHAAVIADGIALDHEAETLTTYAWEAIYRERGSTESANEQRARAEASRLRPPPEYDPARPVPDRPDLSGAIRATLLLLGDPEEAPTAAVTTMGEMADMLSARFNADPRAIDAEGFLVHAVPEGVFRIRRGFGGLSSAVGTRDGLVGIVTDMETGPDGMMLLRIVWQPDADPATVVPLAVRNTVMAQVRMGNVHPEIVPAFGLLALDVDADL